MTIDFLKYKAVKDEAESRAKELSEYLMERCEHSDSMKSLVENPVFQQEIINIFSKINKTDA